MGQQQLLPIPTADRAFGPIDLDNLEREIAAEVHKQGRETRAIDFAPPSKRMPDYVVHRDGVNEIGRLSAEGVVRELEETAKAVEAMSAELISAAKRCEATVAGAHEAVTECNELAAAIREKAKKYFLQIEDVTLMTAEVRKTCTELKEKIAGPAS